MKKLFKSRKFFVTVLALAMVFSMTSMALADTENGTINVYLSVERSLLGGQDPSLAPVKIVVPLDSDGEADVIDLLNAAKTQVSGFNYTGSASYITGFTVPSHATIDVTTDYPYYDNVSDAGGDYIFDFGETPSAGDPYLSERDYSYFGGWMFSLNNTLTWDDMDTQENEAYPMLDTVLEDNDVVRFEYSLALGADIGYEGWDLLTLSDLVDPYFTRYSKSGLIRAMADAGSSHTGYAAAMSVLKDSEATAIEIQNAIDNL